MSLKDYLTLSMSGLSLFISFWIFFKNYRNAKMNLGINSDFYIDSNEQHFLFVRMSFINHSSKPITIKSMKLFDKNKSTFNGLPHPNKYRYDEGDCLPISQEILADFKFKNHHRTYSTSTIPTTIAPYSEASDFYSFYFGDFTPSSISEQDNLFVYIETTEGSFYYPISFGNKCYETRNDNSLIQSYQTYKKADTIEYKAYLHED
jgi:hypothetical protein